MGEIAKMGRGVALAEELVAGTYYSTSKTWSMVVRIVQQASPDPAITGRAAWITLEFQPVAGRTEMNGNPDSRPSRQTVPAALHAPSGRTRSYNAASGTVMPTLGSATCASGPAIDSKTQPAPCRR